MSLSDKEFEQIKKLWAEAYLSLTKMGQIIGKHQKTFNEKMGIGTLEVEAIIQRKDGSVRKTQKYKFNGEKGKGGKVVMKTKHRAIKEFPKEE